MFFIILMQFMYCALSISSCDLDATPCGLRTNVYCDHDSDSNDNYWYFDPRTFDKGSILAIGGDEFRKLINNNIICTGSWCPRAPRWDCNLRGNADCYHVEHIIPTANNISELSGCSVDIRGNLVMAYGRWNSALGNRFLGEKSL